MQILGDRFWWEVKVKSRSMSQFIKHFHVPDIMFVSLCTFSHLIFLIIIWDRHYDSCFHVKETGFQRCWTICLLRTELLSSLTRTWTHACLTWKSILLTTKFSFSSNRRITFIYFSFSPLTNNLGNILNYEIASCLGWINVEHLCNFSQLSANSSTVIFPRGKREGWLVGGKYLIYH